MFKGGYFGSFPVLADIVPPMGHNTKYIITKIARLIPPRFFLSNSSNHCSLHVLHLFICSDHVDHLLVWRASLERA